MSLHARTVVFGMGVGDVVCVALETRVVWVVVLGVVVDVVERVVRVIRIGVGEPPVSTVVETLKASQPLKQPVLVPRTLRWLCTLPSTQDGPRRTVLSS